MKFTLNNNEYELILLHLAGSKLYGNSTPASDTDYRGVFIASSDSKLGILNKVEQLEGIEVYHALVKAGLELSETTDIVIYELNRFVALAIDNNPNIMDTLCFDYKNPEFTVYANEKGKELVDNKHLFISSKLKFTFSGYAISQLNRIKSHHKWIVQYPETGTVLEFLKLSYGKFVDWDWVCDNFGGNVASFITEGEDAQNHTTLNSTLDWDSFKDLCKIPDLDRYRLPRLYDYCYPKDLKAKALNKEELNLKPLLYSEASFRTISPSMLIVYTNGNGIFTKDGNVKPSDPEKIGEFVCLLSIDQMKFKSDRDNIGKLWEWRTKRNEKRSELEEKFGYDTKHASHLVRLIEGVKDILKNNTYNPTLSGDRLQLVKDVRAGKYTVEEILAYADRLDAELNEDYKVSTLQKKPNTKLVNELVLRLQR